MCAFVVLVSVSSVLAKRLAVKSLSEMTCFVSNGMQNLSQSVNQPQSFINNESDFMCRMKKIQRKKHEMRAAKEMMQKEAEMDAANILTNDYDEDMLF